MRRWLGVAVGGVVVLGCILWWLRGGPVTGPGGVSPAPSAEAEAVPKAPRWSLPITEHRGAKRLEGRVTFEGVPVAGAVVTALANHGEEVLSDLHCQCDNHCGRKLLECGCPEAAGQLVELVAARTGEATPLARATSDAEGRFVLEGLDDTELALWADGRQGIAFRAGLHSGDEAVELQLSEGRLIEGVVKGGADEPLQGALVTAIYRVSGNSDRKWRRCSGPQREASGTSRPQCPSLLSGR